MKIFQSRNSNHLYLPTLRYILKNGKSVNPRGLKTKELHPAVTIIEKPRERFLSCYGRNINPFFLVAEAVWILSGSGDVKWINHYNSQLNKYDDGYPDFHGAYGIRMRRYGRYKDARRHILWGVTGEIDQLKEVYKKLKKDKFTRQAVINLWNPFFDNEEGSKDYPCNNISYFKIRNNKLHLHQALRSNDVNLGLYPTNVFQFSMIHEYLASALGIEVGHLLFFSDSLHCYIDGETKKLVKSVLRGKGGRGDGGIVQRYRAPNICAHDIYNYVYPLHMGRDSLENLDKVLHSVTINEDRYRRGDFDVELASSNPFWISVELMLKIYNLRKHKRIYESIEETSYIPSKDFRVLAYQYVYSKASKNKDIQVMEWI